MLNLWLKRPRILFLAIGWTLFILVLSAIPGKDLPEVDIFQADKLVHALMYGILCWLWLKVFRYGWMKSVILSLVLCSLFGMGMELMQETCFEDRYFDWMDVLANETGIVLVPVLFRNRI